MKKTWFDKESFQPNSIGVYFIVFLRYNLKTKRVLALHDVLRRDDRVIVLTKTIRMMVIPGK